MSTHISNIVYDPLTQRDIPVIGGPTPPHVTTTSGHIDGPHERAKGYVGVNDTTRRQPISTVIRPGLTDNNNNKQDGGPHGNGGPAPICQAGTLPHSDAPDRECKIGAHSHAGDRSTGDPLQYIANVKVVSTGDPPCNTSTQGWSTGDPPPTVGPLVQEPSLMHRDGPILQNHAGDLPDFMMSIMYPHAGDERSHRSQYDPIDHSPESHLDMQQAIDGARYDDQHRRADYSKWPYPTLALPAAAAKLYDVTRSAGGPNHVAPRIMIPTDLKVEEWDRHATGHPQDAWLLDAVRFGFPIQYLGPPRMNTPTGYNHSSANSHAAAVTAYINKETKMGALYGPFDQPPFIPWMCVSPLMTRQKPDSQERRVIVDLSYPDGGVNKCIAPHVFNGHTAVHQLPTIEHAVLAIAKACPGETHLAVIDLSRAYRQFPVPPTDWPLLGIYFNGKYFFDGRIPFGARMSSFAMQSVADFIQGHCAAKALQHSCIWMTFS